METTFAARLRRALAMALAAGALAGCAGALDHDPPTGQPSVYQNLAHTDAEVDVNAAQAMISGYRRNNGLAAVSIDPTLTRLAHEQARVMAANNKLDHGAGRTFSERMRTSGLDATITAENIGAGHHTLAEAFSSWRGSPPHRANMLLTGVTRMGIAAVYAPGSKYEVFWALILAGPEERRG
jgi:uncharacterized protein YkwD